MVARRMSSSSRPHTLIRGKGAGVGAWVAVEETGVTKGARVRVAVCTRAGRARVHALSPPARAPLRAGSNGVGLGGLFRLSPHGGHATGRRLTAASGWPG